MPSPFPGMDPYLETPALWPDVHHELISQIRGLLNPALRPHYVARVELRVYISSEDDPGRQALVPDVRIEKPRRKGTRKPKPTPTLAITTPLTISLLDEEIQEVRLEIHHLETGTLVTVIEVLSPTNKIRGSCGRASFLDKRRETLQSDVHWVEIDLLRAGDASTVRLSAVSCDYRILVSRAGERGKAKYWPVSVRQGLPVIGIPLRGKDRDAPLELGAAVSAAYDQGAYDLSIDYTREASPPLSGEAADWADELLREKGLR